DPADGLPLERVQLLAPVLGYLRGRKAAACFVAYRKVTSCHTVGAPLRCVLLSRLLGPASPPAGPAERSFILAQPLAPVHGRARTPPLRPHLSPPWYNHVYFSERQAAPRVPGGRDQGCCPRGRVRRGGHRAGRPLRAGPP